MGEIEGFLSAYASYVALPWKRALSGPEKVWFIVYDPLQERRLRLRLPEFETATKNAGHGWAGLDLTDTFARWMAEREYREAYFETPEDLQLALKDYTAAVIAQVQACLTAPGVDENTVIALWGVAALFGLTHASTVISGVDAEIQGRLLVFFPGRKDGPKYRLLDARDGWNYQAFSITPDTHGFTQR